MSEGESLWVSLLFSEREIGEFKTLQPKSLSNYGDDFVLGKFEKVTISVSHT
jgi:hypothetical protein